jgi:hypothetical protein
MSGKGPMDRHSAAIRILLGEVEPLVTKVAKMTEALDKAREALTAALADFSPKVESTFDVSTTRSVIALQKGIHGTMTEGARDLKKSGAEAAEAINDQLTRRIITLRLLNKDLRRRTGLYLFLGFAFALLAAVVGAMIAVQMLFTITRNGG